MANKARALALDLMNNALRKKDDRRGFEMRVVFTPKWFGRQYSVSTYGLDRETFKDVDMYHDNLVTAIKTAEFIDNMIEVGQRNAVREATNR